MLDYWFNMGLLRNLLHITAVTFMVLMPVAFWFDYAGEWNLFFSGILPAIAPILVIVIALDVLMSQVWKSDAREEGRLEEVERLNYIIRVHLFIGFLLLVAWLAVFLPRMM